MAIFNQDSFTLKDFCKTFETISDEINIIKNCYVNFSSNNNNYRKYLCLTRLYKGLINISPNQQIYFREILQLFDFEFTKLVIRINTDSKNYDINVTWEDFENKIKNITKNDLLIFYKKNV